MALISASDATALVQRAISPERLVAEFGIAEKIVHAANRGQCEVTIDFNDDPRMKDFGIRKGLVNLLLQRGYGIESTDSVSMRILWSNPKFKNSIVLY